MISVETDFLAKPEKRVLEKQTKMIVLFTKGKIYWDKNTANIGPKIKDHCQNI